MSASRRYREEILRYAARTLLDREHEALLKGTPVSNLTMSDLETVFELQFGASPRKLASSGYRPHRS